MGIITLALPLGLMGAKCPTSSVPPCPAGATCMAASNFYASASVYTDGCGGNGGLGGENLDAPVSTGFVGWDHNTQGNRLGDRGTCNLAAYYYRMAFLFNTEVIKNFTQHQGLLKAVVRYVIPASLEGSPIPLRSSFQQDSCVAHLGQALDTHWIGESIYDNNPTPYADLLDLPVNKKAPFDTGVLKLSHEPLTGGVMEEIDITSTVRDWVIGREANNGLVLSGNDESNDPGDGACSSTIQTLQLELFPFNGG
jgi:hypothetical protein